jgi:hypothetical protein
MGIMCVLFPSSMNKKSHVFWPPTNGRTDHTTKASQNLNSFQDLDFSKFSYAKNMSV